jgi:hypothetical protein
MRVSTEGPVSGHEILRRAEAHATAYLDGLPVGPSARPSDRRSSDGGSLARCQTVPQTPSKSSISSFAISTVVSWDLPAVASSDG